MVSKQKQMEMLNNLAVAVNKQVSWLSYNNDNYKETKLIDSDIVEYNDEFVLSLFLRQSETKSSFKVKVLFRLLETTTNGFNFKVAFASNIVCENGFTKDNRCIERFSENFATIINGSRTYISNSVGNSVDAETYIAKDVFRALEKSKGRFKVKVVRIVECEEEYLALDEEEALRKAVAEHSQTITDEDGYTLYNTVKTEASIVSGNK